MSALDKLWTSALAGHLAAIAICAVLFLWCTLILRGVHENVLRQKWPAAARWAIAIAAVSGDLWGHVGHGVALEHTALSMLTTLVLCGAVLDLWKAGT